jgi:hypothetical protein
MRGGAIDVAVRLSLDDRGLGWLEQLIDVRVEAKTTGAAGGADVRRRMQ